MLCVICHLARGYKCFGGVRRKGVVYTIRGHDGLLYGDGDPRQKGDEP